jgi:hypothetical protein
MRQALALNRSIGRRDAILPLWPKGSKPDRGMVDLSVSMAGEAHTDTLEPVSKPSFPRRRESRRTILPGLGWIPACAGMTRAGFETASNIYGA